MSFHEPSLWGVIKQQWLYKMRAYRQVFTSFIFIQLLFLLFATQPFGSSDTMNIYSVLTMLVVLLIWQGIAAFLLTTKGYRYDDVTFICNATTSTIANALFLLTTAVFAASMMFFVSRALVVILLFNEVDALYVQDINMQQMMIEGFVQMLYFLVVGSIGYLIGMLVQWHKKAVFSIVLLVIIGYVLMGNSYIANFVKLFTEETSLVIFTLKALVVSCACYSISYFISREVEVDGS
ncbi:hypothetical protein A374_13985 [Fictibacillus macauensis ZFHKF-1]|uniref:ABC transporter permease n=1 Tax=Fictibacillus macauensis ZFHKF-1 TaxID=1196324 RepID=I8AGJ9_9BACL|nr:hypothetical protein [Fictibacillus macauensis]EIT84807.1 hypothetical protein A374_13985 [Fictibacillus macauensis ZFHKF-1]